MKWQDGARLAFTNLIQTPLRTALTVMGVVIGIGTLVCLFAFGLGIQKLTTDQARRYNALDTIQVMTPNFPMSRMPGAKKGPPPPPLDDDAVARIARLPGVESANPIVQFPLELHRGTHSVPTLGRSFAPGTDPARSLFTLAAGTFFTRADAREIMVQEDLLPALGLGSGSAALNQEIGLVILAPDVSGTTPPSAGFPSFSMQKKEVSCRVVGVIRKQEGLFGNSLLRADFLLPLATTRELGLNRLMALASIFRSPGTFSPYTMVEVRAKPGSDTARLEKAIDQMGFRTISLGSILKEMNQFFLVMDGVLGSLGSISLVVAALGIVNTMIIAVLERRKEIGIMKSVGSTRTAVKQLFFMEGCVIGLAGGVCGYVLGWVMARIINLGLNWYIQSQGGRPEQLFHFPPWLPLAAVAFAVLVSLAAALYPAARAARLDPVESLRYE